MDHKTSKRVNTVSHVDQAKPVQAIAKPVLLNSVEANMLHAKISTEIVQNQDTATKKPFFRRILKRIFG